MVSDADDIKHILVGNCTNYQKPESLLIPVRKIFGSRCVICLPAAEHTARRKILSPAFNTAAIKSKTHHITEAANRSVRILTHLYKRPSV